MNTPTGKLGQYLTTAFDPRYIPSLNAWYDGADRNGMTLSGNNVNTWLDKSGNGRNATAAVAGTLSSNGGVVFNGTTTYYTMSIPYSSNYSIFLVATNTTVAQAYFFSRSGVGGGRDPTFIQGYIGSGIGIEWFEGPDRATIATTPVSPFLVSVDHTQGSTIQGYYYGSQAFNISQTRAYSNVAWDILGSSAGAGGVAFYGGTMQELIFFSNVLTTSQRQSLEGYLAAKWGLTSSLPATHPFKSLPPISRQFAPVDISGCVLWIDAADATTVTLSGNNITQLQDKSSNAYVFATASGFTYNVTKFNGTYPSFYSPTSTAGYSLGSNTSFTLNQPFTAFAVGGNLITPASGGYFWDSTSNANRAALLSFSPGQPTMFAGVELFSTNTTSFTGALILTCQYNTTSSSLFENGVNRSSTSNVGTQNAVSLRLGAAWTLTTNWNGHICEILFFNRLMSTAERQQVEGYLADKWGLRGNLAASHPFKLYSALTPVFTPVQISGCSLWLDALDATTVTLSSGSNVSQWNDKSGNARNFTVGSGTTTYISNSVRLNTSYMAVSNAVNLQNFTYFIVSASPIGIANQSVFGARPGTNTPDFSSLDGFGYVLENPGTSKSIVFYFIATPGSYIVDTSLPSLSNAFISTASGTSAGSYNAWVNGTSSGTASTAARTTTAAGFHIGAQWNGTSFANIISSAYIYEIIVYNTSLPTSQRQSVEGYLANKWGLVSSLPASHPYKKFIN